MPRAAYASVNAAKVRDYLLNPENAQNRGKSDHFTRYGFERAQWQMLAEALRAHPTVNPVVRIETSPHGTKYVVACSLATPDRRNPCLRTVWIIDAGQHDPRRVTAY